MLESWTLQCRKVMAQVLILLVCLLGMAAPLAAQQEEPVPAADAEGTAAEPGESAPAASQPATAAEPAAEPVKEPEPAPTAIPPAKAPVAASGAGPSVTYELKLRGLEERVNELKEKIFRTKARILQLQETVVTGSIGAGARAVLVHRNEMGGSFQLISVQYSLDAQPIFKKVDVDGDLDGIEETEIFNGNIVPGNHNIAVQMTFQGQGFGFFSYVKGYKFKVSSSYTFTAEEGKLITVKVVGFEKGGLTTKLEERPAVRYDVEVEKLTPDKAKTLQEQATEAG